MNFKRWVEIFQDFDLYEMAVELQENFLDDYLNFEDTSVGMYAVGKIDKHLVKDINELEDIKVFRWNETKLELLVDDKAIVVIEMGSEEENGDYQMTYISNRKWEVLMAKELLQNLEIENNLMAEGV